MRRLAPRVIDASEGSIARTRSGLYVNQCEVTSKTIRNKRGVSTAPSRFDRCYSLLGKVESIVSGYGAEVANDPHDFHLCFSRSKTWVKAKEVAHPNAFTPDRAEWVRDNSRRSDCGWRSAMIFPPSAVDIPGIGHKALPMFAYGCNS